MTGPFDDEEDDAFDDEGELYEDPDDRVRPFPGSALIVTPRDPFVAWVRGLPQAPKEADEARGRAPAVYLVSATNATDAGRWLAGNHRYVFDQELARWTLDASLWPEDRSYERFQSWFDVGVSDEVMDGTHLDPVLIDCPPVSPEAVADALGRLPDDEDLFIDLGTGGLVTLTAEQVEAAETDDELDATRPDAWKEAVLLARSAFDEDRYVIVDRLPEIGFREREVFASTVKVPPAVRNRLLDALQGRKAGRRFEETIDRCGLRPRWLEFRRDLSIEAMREWLHVMRIPTTEDGD